MRSFGTMRKNFNISSPKLPSPKKEPSPKARRPVLNPDASPHANRLARPPRVPEIFEEDEAGSDALGEDGSHSPTPITRRKKPRSISSRALASALTASPPPGPALAVPIVATIQVDIDESLLRHGTKRISRRQSGLINVASSSGSGSSSSSRSRAASPPPRPPSPAFGSPLRRDAGLAEEEEEYAAVHGNLPVNTDEEVPLERATSKGKKKRTLMQAQAEELLPESEYERGKRRLREDPEVAGQQLQDVTNAFGARVVLPPLDTKISGMTLIQAPHAALLICLQIRTASERRQIPIQICRRLHLLTVLPAHHSRLPEQLPHRLIFLPRATQVHHRSPYRLPNPKRR
jgi:hypothetical protein